MQTCQTRAVCEPGPPAYIQNPACIQGLASISTTTLDPRPVFEARLVFKARLLFEEIRYAHEKDIAATSKCTSLLLLTYALHVDQVMFGSNFWSNPAKLATLTKDAKLAEPAGKQLDEPVDSRVIMRSKTRMWANAQRDGRPAEYRWRPQFNAAKFG